MKKYTYVQVEEVRECAYCDYKCDYQGVAYCKWGQIEIWSCPKHGKFEVVEWRKQRGCQIR
jgi:hypothetical protein